MPRKKIETIFTDGFHSVIHQSESKLNRQRAQKKGRNSHLLDLGSIMFDVFCITQWFQLRLYSCSTRPLSTFTHFHHHDSSINICKHPDRPDEHPDSRSPLHQHTYSWSIYQSSSAEICRDAYQFIAAKVSLLKKLRTFLSMNELETQFLKKN